MPQMTRLPLVLAAATLLAGCASGMSKDECRLADWRLIGYEDGARGATMKAMSSRRKACANKAGVAPDMAAYRAGRAEGLREFCRPAKGFAVGARGQYYGGVCPAEAEPAFLDHYEKGKKLNHLTGACDRAQAALDDARRRLDETDRREARIHQKLISLKTPNEERIDLALKLKQNSDERKRLREDIPTYEDDLAEAKAELEDYKDYLSEEGIYSAAGPNLPSMADY